MLPLRSKVPICGEANPAQFPTVFTIDWVIPECLKYTLESTNAKCDKCLTLETNRPRLVRDRQKSLGRPQMQKASWSRLTDTFDTWQTSLTDRAAWPRMPRSRIIVYEQMSLISLPTTYHQESTGLRKGSPTGKLIKRLKRPVLLKRIVIILL